MSHSMTMSGDVSRRSLSVLAAISFCHLLNDLMQSLLPAIYPVLRGNFALSFTQVGVLTLVYQITASILQPAVGMFTDRHPFPNSLPIGMAFSLAGLLTLAFAPSYEVLLVGGVLLGLGSSIFHPESSRIARLSSGGAHGLAQSLFQVGGNFGSALGPLLAALVILPLGQPSLAWFGVLAVLGISILYRLARWYLPRSKATVVRGAHLKHQFLSRFQVRMAMTVLVILIFSKYIYLASITNYYVFYLTHRFSITVEKAQFFQFVFFAAVAVGTISGGPLGDRIGREKVIRFSILGVLPFTLLLPYAGLYTTLLLSVLIGLILSSAFPAIVVYAQELLPGRTGMVSGLFFGLIFGVGGIGAAALGAFADRYGIDMVYQVCSLLPLMGLLALWLPKAKVDQRQQGPTSEQTA